MRLSVDEIKSLTAAGNTICFRPDGSVSSVRPTSDRRTPMSPAERMKRMRDAKRVTLSVTIPGSTVTDVTKSETPVTIIEPLPSSPLPPPTPSPNAPTPKHAQKAHVCEEGPSKRIHWDPENGWSGWLPQDHIRLDDAFPACDVQKQLSRADLWLRSNPAKAKKQNFFRFATNWLARAQERGGDMKSTITPPTNGYHKPDPSATPVNLDKWKNPQFQ